MAKAEAVHSEAPVALVTGGAQGIGRVFCLALAQAGFHTVIADLNGDKARSVAEEASANGRAEPLVLDVGSEASVSAGVEAIIAHHGRIDALVNSAAVFSTIQMKPFDQISSAEWNQVLSVNVGGTFLCCRAVAPHMREAGYGRIVNISSAAARMGRPNYLHYVASKGAVEAMTRSIARELGGSGITANSLAPGAILTEIPRGTMTDAQKAAILASQCVPRPGKPEDLVSTLLHLVSPQCGFVTGQTFIVDGGSIHG